MPAKKTRKLGENRGNAGKGRPKGVPNKTTAVLKDAILLAAEAVGKELEPDNDDGLESYLKHIAKTNVKAFASLMGRIIPTQVEGSLTHRYVARMPDLAASPDEWQKQHSPATIQ